LPVCFTALVLSACTTNQYLSPESRETGLLSNETVAMHSSGGDLHIGKARLITANDEAFLAKLELVRNARETIDAAYYIFSEDITSSTLAAELVAAAQRGVRVRLLLDYSSAYKDLDRFSMMQAEASRGAGSLEVRFYNRPTRNIIMDAAYATIGCGDVDSDPNETCNESKLRQLRGAFAGEEIDGIAAPDANISNLNIGSSGIFLSGLYSKQPELMAFAILHGRDVSPGPGTGGLPAITADQIKGVLKLAKIYWRARTGGPFQRLVAKFKLAVAFTIYGDALNPLYEMVAENLPIARRDFPASVRDWDYVTDYLHQKLLLVDKTSLQLGGRNIEDTYHLTADQATSGIVFMDTEILATQIVNGMAVENAFERLWDFRTMVATIDEIRQHAPNNFAANLGVVKAVDEDCRNRADIEDCFEEEFQARAMSQAARETERLESMRSNAERFWSEVHPQLRARSPSAIDVDTGSQSFYLENIPFRGNPGTELTGRTYGAQNGREAFSGKRIHSLVLAGLEAACRAASQEKPGRVIINNAYFFPPSGIVDMLARMLDGRLDCRHVQVTIITNSRASSDLSITNLFARHIAFAFTDYVQSVRDTNKAADFRYVEIQPTEGDIHRSLHSKVWVLGDDIMVGSANADVRSYMMDANNAMFIRQAPGLVREYEAMIDAALRDTSLTKDLSEYYLSTSREQVVEEDKATFRRILRAIGADERLSAEQLDAAETRFVGVLNLIYELTFDGLSGRLDSKEKRARFDRIFKPI